MPNIASAEKRWRQSLKRRARNRSIITHARGQLRAALAAIGIGAGVEPAVRSAESALDSAARKGIIHRNTAARKKSRLMRRANKAAAAPPPATAPTRSRR